MSRKSTYKIYILYEAKQVTKLEIDHCHASIAPGHPSSTLGSNQCSSLAVHSLQSPSRVFIHCNPMDCSTPGFPVLCSLPEFAQTHVHWVSDAIQPSYPLLPPSSSAISFSQHQGLLEWVVSSYEVTKVLELQLHYQSFQWTFRVDFF